MVQTDLSGHTSTESQINAKTDDQRSEDVTSSKGSTNSDGRRSEVNQLRDSEIDNWVAEREAQEENYGYFHLFVVAESSLSGVEHHLRYRHEIKHLGPEDPQGELHTRFGMGGLRPKTIRDQLIEWKLSKLAVPFHSELRDVPAERLRVFVADPAREHLREQEIEIDPVVEKLNQVDENHPRDEQIERRREYDDAKEATTAISGRLEQRVRAIEDTIRARLEFSGRYGGEIPDPDPEYQDLGTNELESRLRDARDEVEQTKQRKDELGQEISEERSQWENEARVKTFSRSQ